MGMTFVLVIWGYVGWMTIFPQPGHESKCFGEGQRTVIAFNLTDPKTTLVVKDKELEFPVALSTGGVTTFCAPRTATYTLKPK